MNSQQILISSSIIIVLFECQDLHHNHHQHLKVLHIFKYKLVQQYSIQLVLLYNNRVSQISLLVYNIISFCYKILAQSRSSDAFGIFCDFNLIQTYDNQGNRRYSKTKTQPYSSSHNRRIHSSQNALQNPVWLAVMTTEYQPLLETTQSPLFISLLRAIINSMNCFT